MNDYEDSTEKDNMYGICLRFFQFKASNLSEATVRLLEFLGLCDKGLIFEKRNDEVHLIYVTLFKEKTCGYS